MGGVTESQGRVEVYHNGEWGIVCDNVWGIKNANVVCRQLGYIGAISTPRRASFGRGSGPIHYFFVSCTGSETHLLDCHHRDYRHGVSYCLGDYARVVCNTKQGELSLYLLGSLNSPVSFIGIVILNICLSRLG